MGHDHPDPERRAATHHRFRPVDATAPETPVRADAFGVLFGGMRGNASSATSERARLPNAAHLEVLDFCMKKLSSRAEQVLSQATAHAQRLSTFVGARGQLPAPTEVALRERYTAAMVQYAAHNGLTAAREVAISEYLLVQSADEILAALLSSHTQETFSRLMLNNLFGSKGYSEVIAQQQEFSGMIATEIAKWREQSAYLREALDTEFWSWALRAWRGCVPEHGCVPDPTPELEVLRERTRYAYVARYAIVHDQRLGSSSGGGLREASVVCGDDRTAKIHVYGTR